MPFANLKVPQGALTLEQKEEIVHKVTDRYVSYFGERARPFTMVLVDEVVDGGWGRANEVLTMAKMGILSRRGQSRRCRADALLTSVGVASRTEVRV